MGKVLLVANTDWYLSNFRITWAQYLTEKGLEVAMVAPRGGFAEQIQSRGFRFIEWNVGRKTISPLRELPDILRLTNIYRSEKPALVHHFTIKPVLYGSLAAKMAKVNAVVNSVTGLGYVFLKAGWKGDLMRLFILPLYKRAFTHRRMRIIFENENDQAVFNQKGLLNHTESIVVQGAGVDEAYFHPFPEPVVEVPLVVFPARMLYDKGLGTLISAVRILKQKTNARIALVGDIDPGNPTTVDEATLRKWEKEGLVEWWGFQQDMRAVYQNCNIVTLPSFGEGLPTVLIEAAACERPIVTTDVPGCRDVVAHGVNGFLVPPNQPEALADAIEKLINNASLRSQMGKAGREIVLSKFTDAQVNAKIFSVYQELLSLGKPDHRQEEPITQSSGR